MFGSQPGKGNVQGVLGYLVISEIQRLSKSLKTTSKGGNVAKDGTI